MGKITMLRFTRFFSLAMAAFGAITFFGCTSATQLLYTNEHTQAIERDTIQASGKVTTTTQNPQDAVNGTIKLAPVESLNLQPQTMKASDAAMQTSPFKDTLFLNVPPGFSVSLYAYDLGQPRDLALRDDGTIFFSNIDAGEIVAISPDGKKTVIVSDLRYPHGIELHNGMLYYTDETHVYRFEFDSPTSITGKSTMMTDKLPIGGLHYTRTIRWSQADHKFYISVGSTTNKSVESDNDHAAVLRMAEGGGLPTVAMRGLRNAMGMDVHPETGDLWAVDNGTEYLSIWLPPDEINILKVGKHYGWPFYYGPNIRDPYYMEADSDKYDVNSRRPPVPPVILLESHLQPSDMQFYAGDALGADWKNSMLIVCHGTLDLDQGFKVLRVRCNSDGSNARVADFITGFRGTDKGHWGSPVGIAISKDGRSFYVSDDRAGAIYKISK